MKLKSQLRKHKCVDIYVCMHDIDFVTISIEKNPNTIFENHVSFNKQNVTKSKDANNVDIEDEDVFTFIFQENVIEKKHVGTLGSYFFILVY